jgi:hypothetical protein
LNYKRTGNVKVLKPALSGGYLKTVLQNDQGKYSSWTVHKFVCLAFFGERNGKEVNHKDGKKTNNNIHNLEYCTRSENVKHAYDNNLSKPMRGDLNGNSKLKPKDIKEIREVAKNGGRYYGRKTLAIKYGVSESHIKDVISKRRGVWSHV